MLAGIPGRTPAIEDSERPNTEMDFDSLYLVVKLNDIDISCLLDTGSTISVLHPNRYAALPPETRPALEGGDKNLKMADGGLVATYGQALFPIIIGGQRFEQRLVVAEIDSAMILGLDFFKKHRCVLDVGKTALWVDGHLTPCKPEKDVSTVFRVTLKETSVIPPLSEQILEGEIEGHPGYTCGIVEASDRLVEKKQVMIAKSIVDPSGRLIPLRVVNLTEQPVKLYRRTCAATCEPLEGVLDDQETGRTFGVSSTPDKDRVPHHLEEIYGQVKEDLDAGAAERVRELLIKHRGAFAKSKDDLGRTSLFQHKIPTGDAPAIRQHPRRLPFAKRADCAKEVERMLNMGVITPSMSPWASPVVMVKKKYGSWRFCIDYRKVNSVTKKDSYPLPRIDDTLDALVGSRWFSTLDLASGYWQVEMDPEDTEKTAFCTGAGGLYQWNVLPFGLTSAGATFERLMERVLQGLHWETCLIYLDDVIIFAKDVETHINRLDAVLTRIKEAGLKISPRKCQIFRDKVEFLGHIVSGDGVATDPKKISAVQDWKTPRCVKEVRSFMGLCSYYRKFVKNFACIAKPLHRLTEVEQPFEWNLQCQEAFMTLKDALVTAPILSFPVPGEPYVLDTDASGWESELYSLKHMTVWRK